MRNFKKRGKCVMAVIMAAAMGFTGAPSAISAMAAQGAIVDSIDNAGAEEAARVDGGVDIEAYGGKVESEYAQPVSGTFSSYNVNPEAEDKDGDKDIQVMEWDGTKQWANAKWKIYIRKPGLYTVSARIKVSQFDIDPASESGFITCLAPIDDETDDLENNTKQALEVKDDYQTVVFYENVELQPGLYGIKIMDGGNDWDGGPHVAAKLDYLQFECTQEIDAESPEKAPTYQDAIDIDANFNKLEAEWYNSGSYNISSGTEEVDGKNIGYAEWSKKDWGNGKWTVYFRQAGTYDVVLRMHVTEPAEGAFTSFKFGIYEDGDPNPDMTIPGKGATDGYEDFTVTDLKVPNTGVWNVKIMDSDNQVSAKLDYIKFILKEADGPKDTGTEDDSEDPEDETPKQSNGAVISKDAVKVWMTSTEKSQDMSWYKEPTAMKNQLAEKTALDLTTIDDQTFTTIHVDPDKTYQTFLGMGSSLEESTIYNLDQLKGEVKQQFIEDLVDPEKGGMTLFRLTIGTADFTSRPFYTYYDIADINNIPADFEPNWYPKDGETGFTIQKDREYGVIDTVKMVQAAAKKFGVEDEVKFFSSSWTPPGWMKNDDANRYGGNAKEGEGERLRGGTLSDTHIDDLAMYYLRYLEEYAEEGIPVYGMTLQNEPGDEFNYPSCKITGQQEGRLAIKMKELIKNSEILQKHGITDVKLWAFDHNCSIAENYVKAIASVDGAMDAIDGIAFHDYSGSMDTMQKILDTYLNKGTNKEQTVNLTERSVWGTTGANSMIDYLRNSAISYNAWVTMLDSNINYHQWPGTPDPTMFARKAGSDTEYWAMPEFYITGQFSRFIRPGYVRVDSDLGSKSTIRNVVFKNPKTNELVAVVVNASKRKQNFKFLIGDQQFIGAVPAGNIATYVWGAENKPDDNKPGNNKPDDNKPVGNKPVKDLADAIQNAANAGLKENEYTADSWKAYQTALANAQAVAAKGDAATAEEMNAAIAALKDAQSKLVKTSTIDSAAKVPATKITLNTKKVYLVKGKSVTIKGVMAPAGTTDKITWKSSKASVATVKNGKITAKKTGTAKITATTTSGKKAACTVKVVKKAAKSTSIKLKAKANVKKGAWILLSPTVKPAKSTDKITWKSSKSSIASVDKYGFVTGKKTGKATITATTSSGKKAKCTVTVK